MARTSRAHRNSSWGIFQKDLSALSRWFQNLLSAWANWLFAFNQRGAQRRVFLFVSVSLLLWFGLALLAHPIGRGRDPVVLQLFNALIAPDVLRHFVVLTLALWMGLRLAAIYLNDIFELNDIPVAERFIRQAIFPSQYNRISIREGKVPAEQRNSPIVRIGGPGLVNVHLENVALFEKVDGTPHILEPGRRRIEALEGFERLRSIIDLRDQVVEIDVVEGRTQDGILVQAKDVRMVYSILRDETDRRSAGAFEQPYPFSPDAVQSLVYQHSELDWVRAMPNMIRNELRDFISKRTLSEFLANADLHVEGVEFVPRDQMTSLFYDFASGFSKRAAARGIQLAWIGVGTWVTPSEIIPAQHLEAWKVSCETRVLSSASRLGNIRRESRAAELLQLIDSILLTFYSEIQDEKPDNQVLRSLALLYREKMRSARDLYKSQNQPIPPELDEAIRYLSLTSMYRLGE
jgi:hypothetical protein